MIPDDDQAETFMGRFRSWLWHLPINPRSRHVRRQDRLWPGLCACGSRESRCSDCRRMQCSECSPCRCTEDLRSDD